MNWQWGPDHSSFKSLVELDRLVQEVILSPDFDQTHLTGFNAVREAKQIDMIGTTSSLQASDPGVLRSGTTSTSSRSGNISKLDSGGWVQTSVNIAVPDGKRHRPPDDGRKLIFSVPGLHYRSLVDIMKNAAQNSVKNHFHWIPFKKLWKRPTSGNGKTQRIHDEMFSSDVFLEAHNELQNSPRELNCSLERVILGLMFWSDSTHLTSFGDASLWPIYLLFANQSKWTRGKPGAAACHHLAYIPKVFTLFLTLMKY